MKYSKIFYLALAGLASAACTDMDDIVPESGTMLATQVKETNVIAPTRAEASFTGLFTQIGKPYSMGYSKPDDWGFLMMGFCNDLESADAIIPDSGYNWFSVCGEYSSRNANYRNPYIRYRAPYKLIADVNTFVSSYPEDVTEQSAIYMIAQARALRAYAYMQLAPAFQFSYTTAGDKPCVPIVTEATVDFTNNPRATVKEVYELIMSDLDYAVENLAGYARQTKANIDQNVAYGLRARANLNMANYAAAASDAEKAAQGYTPASIAEVSKPSFMDISEHNWIWGYDMTADLAQIGLSATSSSWLRSFSGNSYSAACQCYTLINKLLYDKITAGDVRKGWWVDENLESPLLDGLTWLVDGAAKGDVANLEIDNVKMAFLPYTNVKFGCNTIGTVTNDEDSPLMRVEEMILIQAEGYAKSGNESKAIDILSNFVKTYREPDYSVDERGLSLADEIWFQRRVELWGEGFGIYDTKRLNKPMVRFHDNESSTNQPSAFCFNMAADDGWLLMRFPQGEMDTNFGIVDNTDGQLPVMGQNPSLRDGVTD
ncbi:MAG: RagB/SusD family nutrient uptake outer membrane protein [Bacteroidia bacterium]|nr:RagB/SusD family nutrient uptake outer membrane protein [Bacteroidia bacterium]